MTARRERKKSSQSKRAARLLGDHTTSLPARYFGMTSTQSEESSSMDLAQAGLGYNSVVPSPLGTSHPYGASSDPNSSVTHAQNFLYSSVPQSRYDSGEQMNQYSLPSDSALSSSSYLTHSGATMESCMNYELNTSFSLPPPGVVNYDQMFSHKPRPMCDVIPSTQQSNLGYNIASKPNRNPKMGLSLPLRPSYDMTTDTAKLLCFNYRKTNSPKYNENIGMTLAQYISSYGMVDPAPATPRCGVEFGTQTEPNYGTASDVQTEGMASEILLPNLSYNQDQPGTSYDTSQPGPSSGMIPTSQASPSFVLIPNSPQLSPNYGIIPTSQAGPNYRMIPTLNSRPSSRIIPTLQTGPNSHGMIPTQQARPNFNMLSEQELHDPLLKLIFHSRCLFRKIFVLVTRVSAAARFMKNSTEEREPLRPMPYLAYVTTYQNTASLLERISNFSRRAKDAFETSAGHTASPVTLKMLKDIYASLEVDEAQHTSLVMGRTTLEGTGPYDKLLDFVVCDTARLLHEECVTLTGVYSYVCKLVEVAGGYAGSANATRMHQRFCQLASKFCNEISTLSLGAKSTLDIAAEHVTVSLALQRIKGPDARDLLRRALDQNTR